MKEYFTDYFQKPCPSFRGARVFIVVLICAFIGAGSLFGRQQKEPPTAFCGTVSQPDDYKKASFFGNNQSLVDNLIKEGFNIDKDYLNLLENTEGFLSTREKMVTNQICVIFL